MFGKDYEFVLCCAERNMIWYALQKETKKLKKAESRRTFQEWMRIPLERLARKVQSQRNAFLKLIYSLREDPKWFVSILFPRGSKGRSDPGYAKYCLDKLGKRLRRKYPNGWFIYLFEYKNTAEIHLHLLCTTNVKSPKLKYNIRGFWLDIVESDDETLVDVNRYSHNNRNSTHKGYLTKRTKYKWWVKLSSLFGRKYVFGRINKKNIPVANPKEIRLTRSEFKKLRNYLCSDYNLQREMYDIERSNRRHESMLKYSKCGYHILTEYGVEEIDKIVKNIRGKR